MNKQNSLDKSINFSKYSLDELINSKIYINYVNKLCNKSDNKNYLIKNILSPSEYITEIHFNIYNDMFSIFNKLGIYDINSNIFRYKKYTILDDYNDDDNSNTVWSAKYNNALVGIELYYDNNSIIRLRFLEASIFNKEKPKYSKWYGKSFDDDNNNISCTDCSIKTEIHQLIYLKDMFISALQLKYLDNLQSFGRVYFKIGLFTLSKLIDVKKCCSYDENSLEYNCCKILNKTIKCSEKDKINLLKEKINNILFDIIKKDKSIIIKHTNLLLDEIYKNKKLISSNINFLEYKNNSPQTSKLDSSRSESPKLELPKLNSSRSESPKLHLPKLKSPKQTIESFDDNTTFSNIFKLTIIIFLLYMYYFDYNKSK